MKYEINKYRDGQVSSKFTENGDLDIHIRGNSYEELFAVASTKEAWDALNTLNKNAVSILNIYCLIGQRSDRRFKEGESFDLKVIANFINAMHFDQVRILHPHSAVALALINNSKAIDHFEYVKEAYLKLNNPTLISPDAGAYKTTHSIAKRLNADLVPSNKVRINGNPEISIQGDVKGRECLIVDDMADGGRTFTNLAESLIREGATNVSLYVTHGQFNFGFEELKESIDHVYCTNSYRDIDDGFVTQFRVL